MEISVIGGGITGLSAATHAADKNITLYDSRGFTNRQIKPWGGGIADYRAIPRSYDAQGVLRRIDKVTAVNKSSQIDIRTQYGVIIQRDIFEQAWGQELDDSIQIKNVEVTESQFHDICDRSDLVIDATGAHPISQELDFVGSSSLRGTTISAIIQGDFKQVFPTPIVQGHQSGYRWVNPLTEAKAVVGIGMYEHEKDTDSVTESAELLRQTVEQFNIDTDQILRGPETYPVPIIGGRKLSSLEYTVSGAQVRLVGDAASLAHGITGTGLSRAAQSAGEAVTTPLDKSYPENLRQSIHVSQARQLVHRYTTLNQIINSVSRITTSVRYEPLFEAGPASGAKHIIKQAIK